MGIAAAPRVNSAAVPLTAQADSSHQVAKGDFQPYVPLQQDCFGGN
jgi:hypothetical protein